MLTGDQHLEQSGNTSSVAFAVSKGHHAPPSSLHFYCQQRSQQEWLRLVGPTNLMRNASLEPSEGNRVWA